MARISAQLVEVKSVTPRLPLLAGVVERDDIAIMI